MKRLIYLLAAVAFTACGSATSLSVMTFNMRYDNPEDGQNNWRFRRERIAGVIKAQEVDVLGTQELLSNQFNDLSGLLTGYQEWASDGWTAPSRANTAPCSSGRTASRCSIRERSG